MGDLDTLPANWSVATLNAYNEVVDIANQLVGYRNALTVFGVPADSPYWQIATDVGNLLTEVLGPTLLAAYAAPGGGGGN